MLLFTNLGRYGRLGNQMFQYAALKGMARKHGYEIGIPPSNNINEYSDHQLLHHFNLSKDVSVGNFQPRFSYQEQSFSFNPYIFETVLDGTDLMGHFQSEKYFKHIRNELLSDFTLKNNNVSSPDGSYVAIHVRRTDYTTQVNLQYHSVCSEDYYSKAIAYLGKENNFVVLSDDIQWCKQQEIFRGCEFWEGNSNIEDLYVMTKAKHNIIANSSFSWWGAWLNNNPHKIVIAPKKWFGPTAGLDESDIIPDEWIKL